MLITLLKSKLHRATVTAADLDYEGSIGVDADLLDAAGILAHERVELYNITNGQRLATYAIPLPRGSGAMEINGAAAHLVGVGHRLIVCTYAQMTPDEGRAFTPVVVLLDDENRPKGTI